MSEDDDVTADEPSDILAVLSREGSHFDCEKVVGPCHHLGGGIHHLPHHPLLAGSEEGELLVVDGKFSKIFYQGSNLRLRGTARAGNET